jgi:3(or 17)beta-hydroxysteroid dehydrogenase
MGNGRLAGKVALVTGAASGLGLETARLMVREGARVCLTDIQVAAGQAAAAELGAQAWFAEHDVSSETSWQAVMASAQAHGGPLDVLVNNAGILHSGNIETATLATFRRLMQTNAESVFIGCQQGVAAMKARGGAIVNVASIASWLPMADFVAYSSSKAAVAAITRSTALHCRKNGIAVRVNSVHPDGIATPMMMGTLPPGVPASALLWDAKTNPKGRATPPQSIAQVIVFLASDDARAISGAEMHADNAIHGMGL